MRIYELISRKLTSLEVRYNSFGFSLPGHKLRQICQHSIKERPDFCLNNDDNNKIRNIFVTRGRQWRNKCLYKIHDLLSVPIISSMHGESDLVESFVFG